MVAEIASENRGVAKVGKLNIDDAPGAAQAYAVHSIPTIVVFKGGEVVDRMVGIVPKAKLQDALNSAKSA
jgi:thioredoxin 1